MYTLFISILIFCLSFSCQASLGKNSPAKVIEVKVSNTMKKTFKHYQDDLLIRAHKILHDESKTDPFITEKIYYFLNRFNQYSVTEEYEAPENPAFAHFLSQYAQFRSWIAETKAGYVLRQESGLKPAIIDREREEISLQEIVNSLDVEDKSEPAFNDPSSFFNISFDDEEIQVQA